MHLVFLMLCFLLLVCCDCKRHSKKNKLREVLSNNSTDSPESSPPRRRTKMYSAWSPWTRCSRRCKQVRTRYCVAMAECGTNMMREERTCFKDRCREGEMAKNTELVDKVLNPKDRSTNSEFRILYHLQPFPYSEWSSWSPCSRACVTHRTKTCQVPDICGTKVLQESALCYVDDTACERLYSKRRKRKKSSNEVEGSKVHPLTGLKCGVAQKNPGLRSLLRIIGGREAARGSWPWQVTILNKYREPFCGGTLLSQAWVLTAAHCVRKKLLVRAGEHDLMSDEGTEQESRVAEFYIHPDYDADTVNNDVALLRLKHPFNFNQYAQPACLPSPGDELEINTRATILGWGKRKNTAIFGTDHLHQAEVPIVDLEVCRENYENYHISNNMLCAGYKKGRVDSCAGDSGGPLLYPKNDKWTIYGITSFGEGCGRKGKYGIYAKVPRFVRWIKKTIGRFS